MAIGGARLDAVGRSALAPLVGERVPLTAVLTDLPAVKDDQVTLAVRVTTVAGRELREPAHLRLGLDDGQAFSCDPVGPLTEGADDQASLGARGAAPRAEARRLRLRPLSAAAR